MCPDCNAQNHKLVILDKPNNAERYHGFAFLLQALPGLSPPEKSLRVLLVQLQSLGTETHTTDYLLFVGDMHL